MRDRRDLNGDGKDILDRAGVGRATFYAHYRNKQDVHSGLEHLFAFLGGVLDRSSPGGQSEVVSLVCVMIT